MGFLMPPAPLNGLNRQTNNKVGYFHFGPHLLYFFALFIK